MITAICSAIAAIAGAVTAITVAVRRSKKRKAADQKSIEHAASHTDKAIKEITKAAKKVK